MTGKASPPVTHSKSARDARLAEQLRANLARRKTQARGRAKAASAEAEAKGDNDNTRQES